MRLPGIIVVMLFLTACSSPWGPEKPAPKEQGRQQTCQPGTSPNQTDCGHFPEPDFH